MSSHHISLGYAWLGSSCPVASSVVCSVGCRRGGLCTSGKDSSLPSVLTRRYLYNICCCNNSSRHLSILGADLYSCHLAMSEYAVLCSAGRDYWWCVRRIRTRTGHFFTSSFIWVETPCWWCHKRWHLWSALMTLVDLHRVSIAGSLGTLYRIGT